MLCQSCQQNLATTHIKSIVNGELTEVALCPACAQKLGYGHLFDAMGLENFLEGFFGTQAPSSSTLRCPKCGASFESIARSGKVGCAECYRVFREQLMPSIRRLHGSAVHRGKKPGTMAMQVVKKPEMVAQPRLTPLEEKKLALQKAIEAQNFEQAAILRDEIRAMEGKA